MDEGARTAVATDSGARGWRRSVIALSLILLSSAALPRPASAQLTSCALEGEYLLSGMIDLGTGPLYVGGLFVLPARNSLRAWSERHRQHHRRLLAARSLPNTLYSANLPYMGDDTLIESVPG